MKELQCRHLHHALNVWAARAKYMTARPIATQLPGHGCNKRSQTSQLIPGSLMFLAYIFDMLSVGVCTTKHCQTSGRLVQELSVFTVAWMGLIRHNDDPNLSNPVYHPADLAARPGYLNMHSWQVLWVKEKTR